jgi:hypothetical protein
MTSSLDFGRKILMKRLIQALEGEGYRVEFAEDYNGYIVAGQGEDPAVMLLDADTIENQRRTHPGSAQHFIEGILGFVQSQISSQGSASLQPPPESGEAVGYADVPAEPPSAVGVDEDMIVDEASMEVPVEEAEDVFEEGEYGEDVAEAAEQEIPVDEDEDEAERIEQETTEELTLEDFDAQEEE